MDYLTQLHASSPRAETAAIRDSRMRTARDHHAGPQAVQPDRVSWLAVLHHRPPGLACPRGSATTSVQVHRGQDHDDDQDDDGMPEQEEQPEQPAEPAPAAPEPSHSSTVTRPAQPRPRDHPPV